MELSFHGVDFFVFIVLLALSFYVLFTNEIRQMHKVFFTFHVAMMLWPFGMFSLSTTTDPHVQWAYVNLAFVGVSFLGYGWLMFTLMLTRRIHRMRPASFLLLAVPAVVAAVLVTLNPMHGLFATPLNGSFAERSYGPAFWYLLAMSTVYIVLGFAVMLHENKRSKDSRFKKHITLFLFGQLLMLGFAVLDSLIATTGLLPYLNGANGLTSLGILLSDICFIVAIHKHNVFRIITIALREVVDSMEAGIVILDDRHTVIDRNVEAKRFYPTVLGQPFPIEMLMEGALEPSFGRRLVQSFYYETGKPLQTEVLIRNPFPVHVSVRITPIYSNNGTFIGRIVTLQDVTEWRRLVHELHDSNEDLMLRNTELTLMQEELSLANRKLEQLATTDPLTGCYNRRYLFQMLEYQLAIEQRYQVPFSLLLFDVDHFKQINDTYGHHIGDEVLRQISGVIRGRLRESDIFARVGGEEFTVYLPHTEKRYASNLAEEIRHLVESQTISTDRGEIKITISMGLISVEGNSYSGENPKQFLVDVMRKADGALYQAKGQGRNRIVIA